MTMAPYDPTWNARRALARSSSNSSCRDLTCPSISSKEVHSSAKGGGATRGQENGRYQHGLFTCEAIERRRETRAMIAEFQAFAQDILQR